MKISEKHLFNPGRVVATAAISSWAEENKVNLLELFKRHLSGDFGEYGKYEDIDVDVDEFLEGPLHTGESGVLNKVAILRNDDRVISEYKILGQRVWVHTYIESYTTILFPHEY